MYIYDPKLELSPLFPRQAENFLTYMYPHTLADMTFTCPRELGKSLFWIKNLEATVNISGILYS